MKKEDLRKIIKEEIKKVLSESKRYSISFTTDKEKQAVNSVLKSLFKYIDVSPFESEYVIDVYDKFDKIESLLNNLKSKYKGLEVKRK